MPLEKLKTSGRLPSPKGVALKIIELCQDDNATVEALTTVVQRDPALCGRLLKLANTANTGARPIASVPEAVLRIGMRAVRNLATSFALVDEYRDGACSAFDYSAYWSHSLLMAVAMRELAVRTRLGSPDDLFSCGLMARIGELGLATAFPAEYAEVLKSSDQDKPLLIREKKQLGFDHIECTDALLREFGLPGALAEPVASHEVPEKAEFMEASRAYKLCRLFQLGRRIADLCPESSDARLRTSAELMQLAAHNGLESDELGPMIDTIVQQWHEWGTSLNVSTSPLPSFADMSTPGFSDTDDADPSHPLDVLLISQDTALYTLVQQAAADTRGLTIHLLSKGSDALAETLTMLPHIIVADTATPDIKVDDFCRALREARWGRSAYVIALADTQDQDCVRVMLKAGANDLLPPSPDVAMLSLRLQSARQHALLLESWKEDRAQLRQMTAELTLANRKLEHRAQTDPLTGLPNRRAAMEGLEQAWSAAERNNSPLSVMMLDLDAFKSFNDTYGHAVGDRMLVEMGRLLREQARKDDRVCRIGGEEFLIICRNTDLSAVTQAAHRLQNQVRALRLMHGDEELRATISIGVACREPEMGAAELLVNAADKALYAAKHAGRDCTYVYQRGKVIRSQNEQLAPGTGRPASD